MEKVGTLLLEDVGVAVPELPALMHGIREIAERRDTRIVVVAHAGDGNTHPIIAYPPGDAEAEARARLAFGEVMDLALSLGGTITGEHGVGRLKARWLPDQLGPEVMALTHRIKDALDPDGILNPGVVL
jgi:glycolate oxidase